MDDDNNIIRIECAGLFDAIKEFNQIKYEHDYYEAIIEMLHPNLLLTGKEN